MSTLKESINIRELAFRYYNQVKPGKYPTREAAGKQWRQDKNKDMKIIKEVVRDMWKEILEEMKTITL